jgi:hypothetical protein
MTQHFKYFLCGLVFVLGVLSAIFFGGAILISLLCNFLMFYVWYLKPMVINIIPKIISAVKILAIPTILILLWFVGKQLECAALKDLVNYFKEDK